MVELFQHKKIDMTINYYSKLDTVKIKLDKSVINKDINRLNTYLQDTKNKYNKDNLKALIKYLNKIENKNNLEICWNLRDDIPYSYPVTFINEPVYNINTCNYILLDKTESLVEIDLSDLAEIISFELMYEDLGESHASIERKLTNCGILGFENQEHLMNVIRENNKESRESVYELSKKLKISESPYFSKQDKTMYDYFLNKQFKVDNYKEVVDYSCKYASAIIMNDILKNANKLKVSLQPIEIDGRKIVFIINEHDINKLEDRILDDISIRAFGRQFLITSSVSII